MRQPWILTAGPCAESEVTNQAERCEPEFTRARPQTPPSVDMLGVMLGVMFGVMLGVMFGVIFGVMLGSCWGSCLGVMAVTQFPSSSLNAIDMFAE